MNPKLQGKLKKVQVSLVSKPSRDSRLFSYTVGSGYEIRSELSGVRVTANQKKGEKGICCFFYSYNINLNQI